MKKNTFDPRHELTDKQYIYKDGEEDGFKQGYKMGLRDGKALEVRRMEAYLKTREFMLLTLQGPRTDAEVKVCVEELRQIFIMMLEKELGEGDKKNE